MEPFDRMTKLQGQFFEFGDERLDHRAELCLETLINSNCNEGFPSIFTDQYALKAFYRLMNNKKVTPGKITAGGGLGLRAVLQEYEGESSESPEVLYLYQDTTFGSFPARNKLDLGYLENPTDNGVVIHTAILTDEFFTPIGIPFQKQILRDRADYGKSKERKKRPFKEKETFKWVESMDWSVHSQKVLNIKIIHVADREGDMNELFEYSFENQLDFVIRARHDRVLFQEEEKLWSYLRNQPGKAIITRQLLDKNGRPYMAKCALYWDSIQLKGVSNSVRIVYLRQLDNLEKGEDSTEWALFTSLPVSSEEEAIKIFDIYTKRWRTCEDFHKCLKSGCSMEKRQFDSSHAMTNCIAMLSLTALHLLRMRHLATLDEPVDKLLNEQECKLAQIMADKYLKPIDLTQCKPNTALWLVLIIGRMGGHQGIKQKGLPGWKTLWLGWTHFKKLMDGVILSKNFFLSS